MDVLCRMLTSDNEQTSHNNRKLYKFAKRKTGRVASVANVKIVKEVSFFSAAILRRGKLF